MAVFTPNTIASIDIGTTKISVLIAQQLDKGRIELLGVGRAPSHGLRKGVVVDVADTIRSIKSAVQEAELMAGIKIEAAYIGISGGHINAVNSHGMIPIKQGQVRAHDIKQAIEVARAIPIPEGEHVLHVLPQYFILDDQEPVHDPLHLHGVRLQAYVHIITGNVACVRNLIMCCESAGIRVHDIVLEQLASAHAVLCHDEKELGVAMIDIGGGTADVALYQQNTIRYTMVLPVAGQHFTHDLAIGLRIGYDQAEKIKQTYGYVSPALFNQSFSKEHQLFQNEIIVDSLDGTQTQAFSRYDIARILYPRAQELLTLVHDQIVQNKMQRFMRAGLVLTGGGSLLAGMQDLAATIFQVPVRIGIPRIEYDLPQSLADPMHATGYGLLLYAVHKQQDKHLNLMDSALMQRIFVRMKSWISDFF